MAIYVRPKEREGEGVPCKSRVTVSSQFEFPDFSPIHNEIPWFSPKKINFSWFYLIFPDAGSTSCSTFIECVTCTCTCLLGGHNGWSREDTLEPGGHIDIGLWGRTIWSSVGIMVVLGGHFGKWVTGGHNGQEDKMARNM